MRVFAFINGTVGSDLVGFVISENGVVVAQHVSSSLEWARHDLSLQWSHGKGIRSACGEDVEWEFVEPDKMQTHERLNTAFEKNSQLPQEHL